MGNAFDELMKIRGRQVEEGEISIQKTEPLFATPFKVCEVTTEILAARAVAANDLWELRTGRRQKISIDEKYGACLNLQGTGQTCRKAQDGSYQPIPPAPAFAHMVSLTQPWEAENGRWFLPHTNLPHLEKRILDVLGCESDADAVAAAIRKRDAFELDAAVAKANACGGIVFTPEEWLEHPHGKYLASIPVVEIEKIGDSAPEALPADPAQPLSGVRVLEMTRILAGPTCGIALSEHGADNLHVTAEKLPQVEAFVRDTSHGKRSVYLDYTNSADHEKLESFLKEADIFVEGYRPGAMKRHGFGPADAAALRPGIVYVSVNCFGSGGPYAGRAGWDQVAQAVTGMCVTQGKLAGNGDPSLTPVFVCDFMTGLLGSFGAMLALKKRAEEGGSYHVRVSLCQSAMLLQRQGLRDGYRNAPGGLTYEELEPYAVYDEDTVYGDLRTLGPVIRMSETSPHFQGPVPVPGGGEPVWRPR